MENTLIQPMEIHRSYSVRLAKYIYNFTINYKLQRINRRNQKIISALPAFIQKDIGWRCFTKFANEDLYQSSLLINSNYNRS